MPIPSWSELPGAPPPGTFVCRKDSLPDHAVKIVDIRAQSCRDSSEDRSFGLLVLRTGDRITAYVNRCAHFGVPLARTQQQLLFTPNVSIRCNVHYAEYRWADGHCVGGECDGEPLVPVPLDVGPGGEIRISGTSEPPEARPGGHDG